METTDYLALAAIILIVGVAVSMVFGACCEKEVITVDVDTEFL